MPDQFGYMRCACVAPALFLADPLQNLKEHLQIIEELHRTQVELVLFPELSLTGYTCDDLFFQDTLLHSARNALLELVKASARYEAMIILAGLPLSWAGRLWNTVCILGNGKIYGLVPKRFLPSTQEYYEFRWFTPGQQLSMHPHPVMVHLPGYPSAIPMHPDLVFVWEKDPALLRIAVEVCEDAWTAQPPSLYLSARRAASVICNPSASDELLGKAHYRQQLIRMLSATGLTAYLYASSGAGESTTDMVFSGHLMIAETGQILAEDRAFSFTSRWIIADIDLQKIQHDRHWHTSYRQLPLDAAMPSPLEIPISLPAKTRNWTTTVARPLSRHPFVPAKDEQRAEHCREIIAIQTTGLARRLIHTGAERLVIGVSGGIDSTHALLICIEALKKLGKPPEAVLGVVLPGPGSSSRTQENARALCRALNVTLREVTIDELTSLINQHVHADPTSTAYENIQARLRTLLLMSIANHENALMVGTSDLSELALGWCTYGGDHMAMYQVNAGVPKTLIQYLIQWLRDQVYAHHPAAPILDAILKTPITPELLPIDKSNPQEIIQRTEAILGPYEVHDFLLYWFVRYATPVPKLFYLLWQAFGKTYRAIDLLKWLEIFLTRFFANQFKRSAIPNGPKVGTVSLSPRADWRMPSDVKPSTWLAELKPLQKIAIHLDKHANHTANTQTHNPSR